MPKQVLQIDSFSMNFKKQEKKADETSEDKDAVKKELLTCAAYVAPRHSDSQ